MKKLNLEKVPFKQAVKNNIYMLKIAYKSEDIHSYFYVI